VYNHGAFSTDDVNVQTENGLLKLVSSKSTDQSLQVVEGLTGILQQFKATRTALEAANVLATEEKAVSSLKDCTQGLAYTKIVDVTNRELVWEKNENFDTQCQLLLEIKTSENDRRPTSTVISNLGPVNSLDARIFPESHEITGEPSCEKAVCFRLAGAFKAYVRACVVKIGKTPLKARQIKDGKVGKHRVCAEGYVEFLAPVKYPQGFIRFNRRAFVENSVSATFTNGMLTGFSAKDPSELVGFLAVPVSVMKQFTVLVTF